MILQQSGIFNNRAVTIQSFQLSELPAKREEDDDIAATEPEQSKPSIKLEPGVTQPLSSYSKPLKLEIHENYVDSGREKTNKLNMIFIISFNAFMQIMCN